MVTVRHVVRGAYAGCLVQGRVRVAPPEGEQTLSHWDRAYYIASKLEAPLYGSVQSYDGSAMSAGPFHFVAVLPKTLSQGPLWSVLRRLELAQAPVEPLWQALRDGPGWFVARDGVLREFDDGKAVLGAAIRRAFTPPNGKVPKHGRHWQEAKRWALLFHELFSSEPSIAAQREYGIEFLARDVQAQEQLAYDLLSKLLGTPAERHGLRVGDQTGALPAALDLALCVYHAFSVNAPGEAVKQLRPCVSALGRQGEPGRFARELIRKLGTARYGNWRDRPGQTSRYDRTRLVAERSGLWPRALVRAYMPADLLALPVA